MKVAILYICTGKYNQFFKDFYESCEKYFLKGIAQVEYFVFTDDMTLPRSSNVHLHRRKCQGFPLDSLFRFDMFLSIKEELKGFDYLFFFNANMLFVKPVNEEILPKQQKLVAAITPGFSNRRPCFLPYERNKQSTAYIPPHLKRYAYYMGGFNGGTFDAYMQLVSECSHNIHIDYDKGIIARVHDESHINKYLTTHECQVLPPTYIWPEGSSVSPEPKIIIRDKVKLDSYFNKGRNRSLIGKIKKGFRILYRAIIWYLNENR